MCPPQKWLGLDLEEVSVCKCTILEAPGIIIFEANSLDMTRVTGYQN
jgi:hypothetical protein